MSHVLKCNMDISHVLWSVPNYWKSPIIVCDYVLPDTDVSISLIFLLSVDNFLPLNVLQIFNILYGSIIYVNMDVSGHVNCNILLYHEKI